MAAFDPKQLPPLRDVIAAHGLRAKKSLGQNFLLDLNLTDRIVRSAGELGDVGVIEVGPGPGGLTRSLLAADVREVVAVERDPACLAALQHLETAGAPRLHVVPGDALELDLTALVEPPRAVVANLPYNVATALLTGWLDILAREPSAFVSLTLMFQKEVADRLAAAPGSRTYGRLSVLAQWLCDVSQVFDVPARAFTPPPKVTSTVVHFVPRETPQAPADADLLQRVTAAAFGQRRKMVRSSLKTLPADVGRLLDNAGIDGRARAEDLSVVDFCALARALADQSA